jgi:hypothetical protein
LFIISWSNSIGCNPNSLQSHGTASEGVLRTRAHKG